VHQRADFFLCLSARLVFERKGHKMKITYKFVTGEVAEVEVSEEIYAVIVDLDRQEYNNNHKETRRHYSLEGKVYEGMDYAVEDPGLEALFAGPTDEERLHAVIRQLSPDQQEMVRAIYFENVSVNDYAARMGVTQSAISHRLQTVKKKLKKLLG
jgi:RNA polymerase sigma-70 factor (ECF subfamily)